MPYVQNNGVKIYYEVEGVGVPFVLLHGLTQGLLHWREFGWTDQLRQDYQLILIDIRGHGVSDKPYDGEAYRLELLAQDVLAVLDKLGIRKAHCCGYSYGGRLCFQLAQLAPERFHSFVIISSHPYVEPGASEWARQVFSGEIEPYVEQDKSAGLVMTPYFKAQKLADDLRAIRASMTHYDPSIEEVLPTMRMPCLVCVGEGGDSYDESKKCAEQLPNARFRSFPRLTHGQMLRYSQQVVPHIKGFLDEVTPSAEKNRIVIDRLVQALNRGNFPALDDLYAPDWVCLLPALGWSSQGIRALVDALFTMFGDAEVVLADVGTEHDQVITHWIFKGTHTGECMGIAPTNARVNINGTTVDRLQDGKIVETSHRFDLAEFQRQLKSSPSNAVGGK